MIVAGAKHACATCIRGHRSSSCTHADRPLFEIRKKGRPVSQCPHCRDLRKIKSCHTRCECGETPAEQSKASNCKCHSGQPCSCAGPVQIYQYIPPALSGASSTATSATNSSHEHPRTPKENVGSMLHTFQFATTSTSVASLQSANQIKAQNSMPYPPAQLHREHSATKLNTLSIPMEAFIPTDSDLGQMQNDFITHPAQFVPMHTELTPDSPQPYVNQSAWPPQKAIPSPRPRQHVRRGSSSISRSTRSIGVNTDPLPPGLWPENLFEVPSFMLLEGTSHSAVSQTVSTHRSNTEMNDRATRRHHCPKFKDMPLKDLGLELSNLTESTAPVPSFSAFYGAQSGSATLTNGASTGRGMMAIDSFADEDEFDPEDWDQLFDVPGCALPGVQCNCGDGCSCVGCQTHKDNTDHVAFAEFERMDFREEIRTRDHPAGCCDTRSLHMPQQTIAIDDTNSTTQKSCCSNAGQ